MAFHFRYSRRIPIIPGLLYLNVNARSLSLTGRLGPVSHTRSTSGRRTTSVGLPGRGSLRSVSTAAGRHAGRTEEQRQTDETRAELQRRKDAALARRRARRDARRRSS